MFWSSVHRTPGREGPLGYVAGLAACSPDVGDGCRDASSDWASDAIHECRGMEARWEPRSRRGQATKTQNGWPDGSART